MSVLMCAMIIYKHRGNIARLRAGTEHRIGQRPAV
jgi:glycerol-3-phosphate acyltransferase PlsY